MNEIKILALGLLLPFLGTAAGAFCVFFMKKEISSRMESALSAFASGIMMSASVWSLLLPSIERANGSVFPAATGFLAGTAFLLLMDKTVPHFHSASNHSEGLHAKFRREAMLFFAVTLHNIPEGIAVGAVFAASAQMGLAGAFALSAGIALQNFPEGAIVSMPLKNRLGTPRAFLFGVLSGAVEPIFGALAIILSGAFSKTLPWILPFAAGAMVYVIVEELLPEAKRASSDDTSVVSFSLGFVLMMVLDCVLG